MVPQHKPPLLPNPPGPRPSTPVSQPSGSYQQPRPSAPDSKGPNFNNKPPNPDRNTVCQICSKKGHAAKACWYRYDADPAEDNSTSYQAFVAQPTTSSPSNEWYLDSGASHHITHDLNNLTSFMLYEGLDSLQIGDGSGMAIQHIGSSTFTISNHKFVLCDVLHVHSFTKNLLSISKLLHDNSIIIEFSSNFCVIKDRLTLTTLLQAKLSNRLYSLSTSPISPLPQAFVGVRVSADCWHARLGHPSSSATLQVLKTFSLPCILISCSYVTIVVWQRLTNCHFLLAL